ncbi:unnamed protein product [Periconia digitata]|uniref:BRCT domain-containing protein n=1 Tax=Periconia digitata TaxID=1303443 RepID=A0A9W4XLR2_9PLEO|nr:unnamed protein product [Periconia digitata]
MCASMASGEFMYTALTDGCYDDPSQLSQLLAGGDSSKSKNQFRQSLFQFNETAQSHTPTTADDVGYTQQQHDNPNPSPSRRVPLNPGYVQPKLPKQYSAPVSTAIDFAAKRDVVKNMFNTFDVAIGADAPGDTQPDSQMFRQYTSGIVESHSNAVPGPHYAVATPEEPAGEIEIQGSSQSQRSPTITSPTVLHEDRVHDPLTSPLKFETPAVAGRKRDSQGQIISPAIDTTPATAISASAIFGFGTTDNDKGMSLTQAFNATQARTSPIVGVPTEDPVFQRPSPNFKRRSSPPLAMSSPIKNNAKILTSSPALRSSSEPRADYETMKQSQERRSHVLSVPERQDSWDTPTSAEIRFNKRRERQIQEAEAAKSLAIVSAPSPTIRRGRRRRTLLTSRLSSPPRNTSLRGGVYDGPNDSEDGDSPDELSQDIPSTRGIADEERDSVVSNRVEVPNTSSHSLHAPSGHAIVSLTQPDTPASQLAHASQFKTPSSILYHKSVAKVKSSKESEIVMDSQPEPETGSPVPTHPRELHIPSTPSVNQYSINQTTMIGHTGYTSQVSQSSAAPMPPSTQVSDELEEEAPLENSRVPSSPPLLLTGEEESVTYDEHAYDEDHDNTYDTGDAQPTQEDVVMEDEDDLPVAVPEDGTVKPDANIAESNTGPFHGDEIPETLEQEEITDVHNEEEELIRSSHPQQDVDMDARERAPPSRIHRQSTVPETDLLEDTQPPFFPQPEGSTIDTNSTVLYHTGKEDQSALQPTEGSVASSDEIASIQSSQLPVTRSLLEIANQPGTQRSTDIADIEVPQLSFIETDDSTDVLMSRSSRSSPVRPMKKRKVTYRARQAFRTPTKESGLSFDPQFPSSGKEDASDLTPTASITLNREQEQLGALAATRARERVVHGQSEAPLRPRAIAKSRSSEILRKGALKPVRKSLLAQAPSGLSPHQENVITEPRALVTELHGVDKDSNEGDNRRAEPSGVIMRTVVIETTSNTGEAPSGDHITPNRVFAYWPGRNFYPATCLGNVDVRSLHIRYDDGNDTTLEHTQVRALDLRLGDQVKVDQTGMKKQAYVVVGFKDKISVDDVDKLHFTDRYGYATVVLEEKGRDSLSGAQTETTKYYNVPMGYIYLTTTLWGRLRDRVYKYSPPNPSTVSDLRASTPVATHGSTLLTPTMSRRGGMGQSMLRDPTARAASVASSVRSNGTAFSRMAFAITLTKASSDKDSIVKLITSNGGRIIENFDDLFDTTGKFEDDPKTVSGLPIDGLVLKQEHKDLSFVALISDAHSRRLKYLQALALNIPTIHVRWINDSLNASYILPFAKYLLPSGASTYLDPAGVIISRVMPLYNPTSDEASFVQTLKQRSLLLEHDSVLFITGKSKAEIDKTQPYMFLTHALAPVDVGLCKDFHSAQDMIATGEWDWVYVHGGANGVEDAAAILFGDATIPALIKRRSSAAVGKKRKKDEEAAEPQTLIRFGEVGNKKVRLICDEFVIQSLILGNLVDE